MASHTIPTQVRHPCIWMQAGVVARKRCNRRYDCLPCGFDRALRRTARENKRARERGETIKGRRGRITNWQDEMRKLPRWQRPCVHHMKGRISFRTCTNDYGCGNCDFNQFFQDQYAVHTVVQPVAAIDVAGVRFPHGYYLYPGHTWVRLEAENIVRIGLDDFCGHLVGTCDRIQLPLVGKTVARGQAGFSFFCDGNRAAVPSPVSGVVTDVNPRLAGEPGLMASDPYTEGWLLRVHAPQLRHEMKGLMMGEETRDFLKSEADTLLEEIEMATGMPLAADGGDLVGDILRIVPALDWQRLTSRFLRLTP